MTPQKPLSSLFRKTEPLPNDEKNLALEALTKEFSSSVEARQNWTTKMYTRFIERIDVAQTQAFLLKGKLLEEVKNKFFSDLTEADKWTEFCEKQLNINYTTANQYIRVAQEFNDVTSHHRPDFGFEHYKVLLPMPKQVREEFIKNVPRSSVKELRELVRKKIQETSSTGTESHSKDANSERELKRLFKQLAVVKQLLGELEDYKSINQNLQWQLGGACMNVAAELNQIAARLMPSVEIVKGQLQTQNKAQTIEHSHAARAGAIRDSEFRE